MGRPPKPLPAPPPADFPPEFHTAHAEFITETQARRNPSIDDIVRQTEARLARVRKAEAKARRNP